MARPEPAVHRRCPGNEFGRRSPIYTQRYDQERMLKERWDLPSPQHLAGEIDCAAKEGCRAGLFRIASPKPSSDRSSLLGMHALTPYV